jgi:hypothetical protein
LGLFQFSVPLLLTPQVAVLRSEVGSWENHRNRTEAKVRWRFTTEDARIKLEKLYPVFEYPDPH